MITLISHHAGIRFAEVGYLLIVIAGIWFAAGEMPSMKWAKTRRVVVGALLAAAGILLIIAVHWGGVN